MQAKVVIVGAGFGGLWAARTLANNPSVEVTLVDRHNYHTFLALLYQVAAAELGPEDIAYPVRGIIRSMPNISFLMAEVKQIDCKQRLVFTDGPAIAYDFIIIAVGSSSYFLGIPGASEYAFPLKTIEEGTTLRNHILKLFERTIYETDEQRCKQALTFVIAGGGATGVELSGALTEFIRGMIKKDYPPLLCHQANIILIEARDTLLPGLPERCGDYALKHLKKIGVDVHLRSYITGVDQTSVYMKKGGRIPAETVVWTVGVQGNPLARKIRLPIAENGRVPVLPTLQVSDNPNTYVIGDLAFVKADDGRPLPMLAQPAMQEGTQAAKNILRQISGQSPLPFCYKDFGTMIVISRNSAITHFKGRTLTGFPAWIIWLLVHLVQLIGFRSRLLVLINWGWSYFFRERAIRLIFPVNLKRTF